MELVRLRFVHHGITFDYIIFDQQNSPENPLKDLVNGHKVL